jgi:hypothetical protein
MPCDKLVWIKRRLPISGRIQAKTRIQRIENLHHHETYRLTDSPTYPRHTAPEDFGHTATEIPKVHGCGHVDNGVHWLRIDN